MDWITKLAHKRDSAQQQKLLFDKEASRLWKALNARLKACAETYDHLYPHKDTGVLAVFDAGAFVMLTRNPTDQTFSLEKCRVGVVLYGKTIKASYSSERAELLLIMGSSPDGEATFQYDGSDISVDHACELILRPILFEDFPAED